MTGALAGPVAVVGPTAVGKSELGVALALALGGEVVNADSMQLYRGMDIGTAKLTPAERRGVPHHLLDVWDVTAEANVVAYRDLARAAVDDIRARGRLPILVGGSGLYVRAVMDELDFPGTDPELRARLEAELAEHGPAALHARLAAADPDAAAVILPSNGRRVVRALEVVELRGSFTAELPAVPVSHYPGGMLVGLSARRETLDARIEARVARMWEQGLVAEVAALVEAGLAGGRTASRALGYAQVLRFLAGEWTEEQAREATVRQTRRFARRQEAWWRADPRVHWLEVPQPFGAEVLVTRTQQLLAATSRG